MIAKRMKFSSALKLGSAFLALSSAPALAAECFDRDSATVKAGNATAVVGPDVGLLQEASASFARPRAGDDVFTGDRVRTGGASHLQLKLCDWSTYSFPPESESRISEFYDAEGAMNRRVVNFVRGGFRLSSGRDTRPGGTEVELQESGVTMGVRGTNVILVELDGFIYALLEGPALDNTGLSPQGRIEFWTGENREAIEARLTRPGWAVRIGPDGVSEPFRADPDLLQRIYQAFVPGLPEDEGDDGPYEDDPRDGSGEGAQDGLAGLGEGQKQAKDEDDDTEKLPLQPSEGGIPFEERFEEAFPIQVGDILPIEDLQAFAAAQANPDGRIFVLAPAQLFFDGGQGPQLIDDGVALIQIEFDFATQTIAPEAAMSFVQFDFSVVNAAAGLLDDPDNIGDFAYIDQTLASLGIPFASGEGGLAVYNAALFGLTIRAGANDTITVDVASNLSRPDPQSQGTLNTVVTANDLLVEPGRGELAAFSRDLNQVFTFAEFENFQTSGTAQLYGVDYDLFPTADITTVSLGVAYAQMVIDFDNRTVGGPGSFLAVTESSVGAAGEFGTAYLDLSTPTPFSAGLFGRAIYPLNLLAGNDPALVGGQALFGVDESNDSQFFTDIVSVLALSNGANVYSDVSVTQNFFGFPSDFPLTTIAELDGLVGQGLTGAYFYENANGGSGQLIDQSGGFFSGVVFAAIDVSFANRTIGGGDSHIGASLFNFQTSASFDFVEFMATVPFSRALGGSGLFALDDADLDGDFVQSALFMIRNNAEITQAGATAELFVRFTDGAGGEGSGDIFDMIRQEGAAVCTRCQ